MKSNAARAKSKSTSKGNSAARLAKARVGSAARAKPGNPLLARWGAAFGLPPFKKIDPAHFKAAFATALKEHKAEIAAIGANTGVTMTSAGAVSIGIPSRSRKTLTRTKKIQGDVVMAESHSIKSWGT